MHSGSLISIVSGLLLLLFLEECASSFFFCSLKPDIISLVSAMEIMSMEREREPVLFQRGL